MDAVTSRSGPCERGFAPAGCWARAGSLRGPAAGYPRRPLPVAPGVGWRGRCLLGRPPLRLQGALSLPTAAEAERPPAPVWWAPARLTWGAGGMTINGELPTDFRQEPHGYHAAALARAAKVKTLSSIVQTVLIICYKMQKKKKKRRLGARGSGVRGANPWLRREQGGLRGAEAAGP